MLRSRAVRSADPARHPDGPGSTKATESRSVKHHLLPLTRLSALCFFRPARKQAVPVAFEARRGPVPEDRPLELTQRIQGSRNGQAAL